MKLCMALVICILAATIARADDFSSLGYREDTIIVDETGDDCVGTRIYNHDYSFENGYCWQLDGIAPPYYGAWGEAFDTGPVTVECGLFWWTTISYYYPRPADVYLWSGGVAGPPHEVLAMLPDILPHAGFWPTCSLNEIEIDCCVSNDFTVGFWFDDWDQVCITYICADESGTPGNPWTCIAPGTGYPSGWQHPRVVHPNCSSLGIGATITWVPSPVESKTWGAVKELFR